MRRSFPPGETFEVDGGPEFARRNLSRATVTLQAYEAYATNSASNGNSNSNSNSCVDSAPLYIFDSSLHSRESVGSMPGALPPLLSSGGLLVDVGGALVGSSFKPLPDRWLLVGCERSGTPIHDHPMTVGWNLLTEGVKLWAIFPKDATDEELFGGGEGSGGGSGSGSGSGSDEVGEGGEYKEEETFSNSNSNSAVGWFEEVAQDELAGRKRLSRAVVVVQKPGEVVFLPCGWYHCVLNCATTTAASMSLCTVVDFKRLWPELRGEDEEFAEFWMGKLRGEDRGVIDEGVELELRAVAAAAAAAATPTPTATANRTN